MPSALSDALGKRLPYDDLPALRKAIIADAPHFANVGEALPHAGADATDWSAVGVAGTLERGTVLAGAIGDYYLTNPIARASETMAKCSREFVTGAQSMAAE